MEDRRKEIRSAVDHEKSRVDHAAFFCILKKLGWISATVVLLILIIFLSVTFFIRRSCRIPDLEHRITAEQLVPLIRDGDFIARKGFGFWSDRFCEVSPNDKRYSHVGILTKKNTRWYVIHSKGDDVTGTGAVRSEPLEDFLYASKTVGVWRMNVSDDEARKIAECADYYSGVPFDWKFDLDEHEKLYCTELIFMVLKDVRTDVHLKTEKYQGMTILPVESCCGPPVSTEVCSFSAY